MRSSFPMPNTANPSSGPVGIPVPFNFNAGAAQNLSMDLALEQMAGKIDFIQSIFIDNRTSGQPFTILFSGMQYTIQCRPGRSGIWPVLAAQGALAFTANCPVVAPTTVNTIMFNTDQSYFYWDN